MKTYDIDSLNNRDPELMIKVATVLGPLLRLYFRPIVRGLDLIPHGAGLFVGNHSAALLAPDSFVFGAALLGRFGPEALPYGLAHENIVGWPVFNQILSPLGAVRAGHHNAHRLFEAGRKVLVYPGGDIDAMRPYRDRHKVIFGERRGYIRLALRGGVPIIPLVSVGAHSTLYIITDGRSWAKRFRLDKIFRVKVMPLTLSLPWGLTIGPPPPHIPLPKRFIIECLAPVEFERTGEEAANDSEYVEACHQRVHGMMSRALERLAVEWEGL